MSQTSNAPAVESGGAEEPVSQAGTPSADYIALLAGLAAYLATLSPDQCDIEAQFIADQFGKPIETVWTDLRKRHPTAWRESGRGLEAARNATRFRLVKFGELEPRPMDWLVSGLFERETLLMIFGDAGAGKTFTALDLAFCISSGKDYHGRAVKQGPVVYVAGEGQSGLVRRRKAWEIVNGLNLSDCPLLLSEVPAAMTDDASVSTVLEAISELEQPPELIVLDTLARNSAGADENSTKDMGDFIRGCDELRMAFGCTVAVVHHTGHGDKSRGRGSTVLNGAMDAAYQVSMDDNIVWVKNTKMKDGETPAPLTFEFRTVELGIQDEHGKESTSAVLFPAEAPEAPPVATGKHQKHGLECLDKLTQTQRENLKQSGGDPNRARVRLDDWRDACTSDGMPRPRWYEVQKALTDKGVIQIESGMFVSRRCADDC